MAQKKDSFFLAPRADKSKRADKFRRTEKTFEDVPKENETSEGNEIKTKRPFDKKTYRLKKYSNKYKLEKWEDQRKKKLLRTYYKEVKNVAPSGNYRPINFDEEDNSAYKSQPEEANSGDDEAGRFVRHPDLIKDELDNIETLPEETAAKIEQPQKTQNSKTIKKDAFWKAKAEFSRLKQSKEQKKKEIDSSKKEKEPKMMEYRKKKAERFKKLSRKTKKGQPVMTGRLELLLEKIVKNK